jgi:calcineurin-like phosphoesterase
MGYVTDAGMTGPFNSVIGMKKKTSINRFLLGTPQRFHVAKKDNHLCGVLATINLESAKCTEIQSIIFPEFQNKTE